MLQNRRGFLRTLGLTGFGITLLTDSLAGIIPFLKKRVVAPLILSGRVHTEGRGLEGIAVTDGITVAVTDGSGNYSFESNSAAPFVYISLPRGYEFNNEKGIADFYRVVQPLNGKFHADFSLRKLAVDDTKHAFVVWADTQIQDKQDAELLKSHTVPDARALVKNYGNVPLHGIGCGDLIWDQFELFSDYREAVGATGIPFFQVVGNHDMDLDARTDHGSVETFMSHFGPTYYSFNRGEVHYVVLDDVFFLGTSKRYIGYIPENQFAWLEQDLAHVKPGSTVVVAVHIPVNSGVKKRNNLKDDPISGVVSNRRELYRMLKPFKAHIMSGHTHFNEKVFEDDIIEHVHGAVCGAWWTGPICDDGTPNGYGVYEVDGGAIKWYHKSVGQERDYQFRIYPTGAVPEKAGQFCVNVWNWDPDWKVEWLEDGKPRGEMMQATALDPLSVFLHAGKDKPAKRTWVEPGLTDHLFFAKHSEKAKKITVQVTDRFGEVYKEEVEVSAMQVG